MMPFVDFKDQLANLDLDSLARENSRQHLPTDADFEIKVKNPGCYPIASRTNVLHDFQFLVEQD